VLHIFVRKAFFWSVNI